MAKLGDVCTIYTGTGFPMQYQGNLKGTYPFYKVGDIAKNVLSGKRYLSACDNYIEQNVVEQIRGNLLPPNTVVFAKIGEAVKLNRRAITSCECLVDNNVMGILPNTDLIDLDYFYHYMCQLHLETLAEATTVPSVKKSVIANIDIPLPSLREQKNIATVLNKISYLIDLRHQQLSKLDELVKARFVEMFGTFPANEKGWEIGTIRDVVTEVRYGSSRKSADGGSGQYPYLRMNNITYNGELDLTDTRTIDVPEEELSKCTVKRGDVLFNRTNSKELVGKTCVYNRDEMMVLAGFVVRVRVNDLVLPEFLSGFLNTDFSKKMLLGMCKTAIGQANINAQELQNIELYLPSIKLQEEFVEFKNKADKSKLTIQQSLDKLELLKKALMQEYFG